MACHGQAPRGATEPPDSRAVGRDPQIAENNGQCRDMIIVIFHELLGMSHAQKLEWTLRRCHAFLSNFKIPQFYLNCNANRLVYTLYFTLVLKPTLTIRLS